jgi:peroxygenase
MPTTNAMRLFEVDKKRAVLVDLDARRAYADQNGDGKIDAREELVGAERERAVRAAAQVKDLFVAPVPGTKTPDDAFVVDGVASAKEVAALAAGGSVDASRSKLKQHLDFFDVNGDDKLGFKEVFRGFRAVGLSPLAAGFKTTAVALLFGRAKDGFEVDIDAIGSKRYANNTGIFDKDGRIDEQKLGALEAVFDKKGGSLTQDELIAELNARGTGLVSKNQFRSLFSVTKKMNGDDTIKKSQLRGLFDGSLLWRAGSLADSEGHRGI